MPFRRKRLGGYLFPQQLGQLTAAGGKKHPSSKEHQTHRCHRSKERRAFTAGGKNHELNPREKSQLPQRRAIRNFTKDSVRKFLGPVLKGRVADFQAQFVLSRNQVILLKALPIGEGRYSKPNQAMDSAASPAICDSKEKRDVEEHDREKLGRASCKSSGIRKTKKSHDGRNQQKDIRPDLHCPAFAGFIPSLPMLRLRLPRAPPIKQPPRANSIKRCEAAPVTRLLFACPLHDDSPTSCTFCMD